MEDHGAVQPARTQPSLNDVAHLARQCNNAAFACFGIFSMQAERLGALFTYSTAERDQGERITRAAAGEIGIGPFDLEMAWDAGSGYRALMQEEYEEDPELAEIMFDRLTQP